MQQVAPHREGPLLVGLRFRKFRHGQLRSRICDQSQRPSVEQKRISHVAKSGEEHSIIWGMFMVTMLIAATFKGKNFSTIQSVVKNCEELTLKQIFDVTAQLVNNQEEINCLDKILWGKNSWTRLSLIDDEIVTNLQSTEVYVISDSVLYFGWVHQHPESNEAWETGLNGSSLTEVTAILTTSKESQLNSSGIFSQDTLRCSSVKESVICWVLEDNHQKLSHGILFMSMFNDISCDRKDNKE